MTFFGALGTAVSGVNAAATWVSNISDNIANSTTNGYKAVETRFSDLVHNKVLGDSPVIDSNKHGGVLAYAKFENRAQGGYLQTGVSTNFAVSGAGFVPVGKASDVTYSTNADGELVKNVTLETAPYYTRLSDFTLDAGNYLVNSAGYYLMASPIGTTNPALFQLDDSPIDPIPSSNIDFTANLPANAEIGTSFNNTTTIYTSDPASTGEGVGMTWVKGAGNTWDLTISAGDTGQTTFGPVTVSFANGSTPPFQTGRLESLATADAGLTVSASADGSPATIAFTADFGGVQQALTLNLGNFNGGFDATATSGLTQYSTANGRQSNVDITQDGLPGGDFSYLSFNELGHIVYNYDNGRSQTEYQVTLANFNEPDRLDRIDGTAFQPTRASGSVFLGNIDDPDNPAGVGHFVTGAVEQSTVDVAEQMTNLIQAQQAYGLNGQVITAADQMLSRLIELKS
ncbi:flagellar hook-basal body complex protein [Ferrovibrio sp.]|uniref:flagellar hook-basal body complex protein n=1 Tax=Ferrovibrio sp. TaxID=1917215 RepID=UPI0035B2E9B0